MHTVSDVFLSALTEKFCKLRSCDIFCNVQDALSSESVPSPSDKHVQFSLHVKCVSDGDQLVKKGGIPVVLAFDLPSRYVLELCVASFVLISVHNYNVLCKLQDKLCKG